MFIPYVKKQRSMTKVKIGLKYKYLCSYTWAINLMLFFQETWFAHVLCNINFLKTLLIKETFFQVIIFLVSHFHFWQSRKKLIIRDILLKVVKFDRSSE